MQALLRRVPRRGQGRARRRPREGVVLAARSASRHWRPSDRRRRERSRSPTPSSPDTGAKVLVLANEDYTGFNPDEPPYNGAPRYLTAHVNAVRPRATAWTCGTSTSRACRTTSACSSHYKAVVWYLGRQPLHAGRGGLPDRHGAGLVRRAAVHRRGRAPAVPHAGGARLPQRGRQARQHGRDGAGLRHLRRHRRGPVLRPQRRPDGRVRDHHRRPRPVRRLPDPGQRLPPVLPRRVRARQPRRAEPVHAASRSPIAGSRRC